MRRLGIMVLAVWGLVGCGPSETDVTVGGTVSYPNYSSGKIVLQLVEDSTKECSYFSCSSKTPGDTVGKAELDLPGAFSMRASVQGTQMVLLGYALGSATEVWNCEAGAAQSLSVGDHSDVTLELEVGRCPALD